MHGLAEEDEVRISTKDAKNFQRQLNWKRLQYLEASEEVDSACFLRSHMCFVTVLRADK
jgi:hypothetical protein